MPSKNTVDNVKNLSSSLLREFEETPDFSEPTQPAKEASVPEKTNSVEPETAVPVPAPKQTSKKASSKKVSTAEVSKEIDAERVNKRSLNLYLPEEDVKYLKDLARVIGKNPTTIIRTWLIVHRKEKGAQVEAAIKQIENTQNLL
jgi:hypothetical protein